MSKAIAPKEKLVKTSMYLPASVLSELSELSKSSGHSQAALTRAFLAAGLAEFDLGAL